MFSVIFSPFGFTESYLTSIKTLAGISFTRMGGVS